MGDFQKESINFNIIKMMKKRKTDSEETDYVDF